MWLKVRFILYRLKIKEHTIKSLLKKKLGKELNSLKFDNDFREIKIRHVVVIYLITIVILITTSVFILSSSDGEISNSNINNLSLLAGILLFIMLIYKIKPSKEKINLLFKDFKETLNMREIARISIFFTCLNIGTHKIIIDIIYLISPSFANDFINDSLLTINSVTDYWMCFVILVVLSPIIDELIFRHVLFKRLSKKFNVYVGLIVSSLIFSAFNICPEMIGALVLGVINCILYVKYENILIPMLLYFINSFLYMLESIPFWGIRDKLVNLTVSSIMINVVLGIILFIIGIIFFIKFIIKNRVYLKKTFNENKNMRIQLKGSKNE